MKKTLALVIAAMVVACSLISCSNNVENVEAETEAESDEPVKLQPGQYASVGEYIEANSNITDDVAAAYGESVNLELKADGNKMVYSFSADAIDSAFLFAGEMNDEETKAYFDPIIDRMANSMGQAVIEMRYEIPSLESIVIEYTFTDGTPIYSREITEEDATKDYGETSVDIMDMQSMTVEEWAKNLGAQNQSNDYYTLNVEARGNSLAYVYTLNETMTEQDVDFDVVSASMEEMRETVEEVIVMIRTNCPQLESVIYEYALSDGTVIYSYQFN